MRRNKNRKYNRIFKIFVITAAFLPVIINYNKRDAYAGMEKHIEDYALFSYSETSDRMNLQDGLDTRIDLLGEAEGESNSLNSGKNKFTDTQWYINNPGYFMDYSYGYELEQKSKKGMDMNVSKAWQTMAESEQSYQKVIVAVIDTGVDYTHPELLNHLWVNKEEIPGDNIDNDNNGYIDDTYGWDFYNNDASVCHYEYNGKKKVASKKDNDNHGTHIAGIIAADADNNIGIAGIASNIDIEIMVLKINGGKYGNGKLSDAVKAIKYADMMGADICNISWGTTQYSKELLTAMKKSDMLFIAAAGNSGVNDDKKPLYPVDFKLNNVISVAAIDPEGELAEYSNYGAGTVDIAAPGDEIYSTIVGGYGSMSGSSMAAPQVTSVAALLYSLSDQANAVNVKDIIINNIKAVPNLKNMVKYAGIPDAYKAVTAAATKLKEDIEVSAKDEISKDIVTQQILLTSSSNGASSDYELPDAVEATEVQVMKNQTVHMSETTVGKDRLNDSYQTDQYQLIETNKDSPIRNSGESIAGIVAAYSDDHITGCFNILKSDA